MIHILFLFFRIMKKLGLDFPSAAGSEQIQNGGGCGLTSCLCCVMGTELWQNAGSGYPEEGGQGVASLGAHVCRRQGSASCRHSAVQHYPHLGLAHRGCCDRLPPTGGLGAQLFRPGVQDQGAGRYGV